MIRYLIMLVLAVSFAGCGTLDKLRQLTSKSTVEECTDITKEIVAKACKNIGEVRDKSNQLVEQVKIATEVVK